MRCPTLFAKPRSAGRVSEESGKRVTGSRRVGGMDCSCSRPAGAVHLFNSSTSQIIYAWSISRRVRLAHVIFLGHSPLERIEPFGEFRAVVRAGRVVTVMPVIRPRQA
jgi:hypothetical protein